MRVPCGFADHQCSEGLQIYFPLRQATRDRVLGEIANWLMDVDSRCWLGRHASREVESLPKFTRRLVYLKTDLGLANAVPNWSCGHASEQPAGTKTVVVRFGSMMVFNGDLVPLDDRRRKRLKSRCFSAFRCKNHPANGDLWRIASILR